MGKHLRWLTGWLGLMLMGATITYCTSAGSFCDAACDCAGCTDREYDDCVYDYEDEEDHADKRNCLDEWDEYADCVDSGDGCRGRDPDYYCDRELERYGRCAY